MDGAPGARPVGERPPRVFLSYAHEDAAFSDLVRRFYEFLRIDCGNDAVFDRVAGQSPQEWTAWMIRQMAEADFVLCAVSPQYRAAAHAELPPDVRRGAQWETRIIREQFCQDAGSARARVLPVLLPGRGVADIPIWMGPIGATHYRVDDFSREAAEKLLRYLTGPVSYQAPALGPLVDFGPSRVLRLAVRPGPRPGSVTVALTDGATELASHSGQLPTVDPWAPLAGQPEQAEPPHGRRRPGAGPGPLRRSGRRGGGPGHRRHAGGLVRRARRRSRRWVRRRGRRAGHARRRALAGARPRGAAPPGGGLGGGSPGRAAQDPRGRGGPRGDAHRRPPGHRG